MLETETNRDFMGSQLPAMGLRDAFESALPAPGWNMATTTDVFVGLFDLYDWQPWLADAYAMLDAPEHRRVASRRAASDRDALALGYALHRLLLGKALDCAATDVPIGRDGAGCPRLPGELLSTSLSHADRRVVALAVTATGPVGVDIESAARASVMPEIAGRVCHSADTVNARAGLARNEALLALWVRKEAFLKAAGIGLQREMQTFPAPDNALLALPGGETTWVRMLDAGPHWIAAVAGAPDIPATCAWLHPRLGRD